MIEIEIADTSWYGVSRIFPSGPEARDAWETVNHYDRSGSLDIGVFRHQRIGLDHEPVLVTAVGMRREGVEKAESLLGGEDVELHPDTWLALIKRRVEVVLKLHAEGKRKGRYEIAHPPGGDRIA